MPKGAVSLDVSSSQSQTHKHESSDEASPSKKDGVAREASLNKRLSVRDLANKFDAGKAAARDAARKSAVGQAVSRDAASKSDVDQAASPNAASKSDVDQAASGDAASKSDVGQAASRDPASKSDVGQASCPDAASESDVGQAAVRNDGAEDHVQASEFDSDQPAAQNAATKEAMDETDMNLLDSGPQFKTLRRVLHQLHARVAGRNKVDIETALKVTEALSLISLRRETELAQEKEEVKKMALLVDQTSENAKKMVEEVRAAAHAEIEAAKVQSTPSTVEQVPTSTEKEVESAPSESEQVWTRTEKRELEELKNEAREARRIKLLHESSKIMDMENQIDALRKQLLENEVEIVKLRKELEKVKRHEGEGGKYPSYVLTGHERLGTTLSIAPAHDEVSNLSLCSIQWYRISTHADSTDLISGAIRRQYAPEPLDVGSFLRAEISFPSGNSQAVRTTGPIEPALGLDKYVETLVSNGGARFNVRIVLKNGELIRDQYVHTFDVNKTRIKLHKSRTVKAKETYSSSMQLCGARGGGDSAAQGLFWVAKKGLTFMLVLESERERNAAIMVTRMFAKLHDIHLGGPDDLMSMED